MSVSALEKLQRGLNFGPRTIIFPSRQVPIDVFVSLLWAGKFMYAYAENDPRTPMIITSLCMLSFAFARGKIARSDRIVISGLPRQLDWPHGGNWRQPDDVLRVGELILQQIRRDLTEIANG
jgi:hypothetical protein